MDTIFIDELKAETLIGVYPWERQAPQTLQLDLEIALPDTRACESDTLAHTIDYGRVVERIREELRSRHFLLLEALGEHIARLVMEEFGAPWVRLSVAKLQMIKGVRRLGVRLERGRRPA